MADTRIKAEGTYSGVSDKNMNTFRDDVLAEMTSKNVSGFAVLNEGNAWIQLEGDEFDVTDVCDFINNYGILTTFATTSLVSITSRQLNECYLYYKNLTPVTSLP
ncbi:hypothetical protein DL240_11060 [Lujinxingia litoralis]|uniref:Uncharacterized protein n=1 Tax=Lujinxingia litoralis TaxID=2211119 RepID=A0A328C4Y4_9DELT|nr:hypothetical protein [Lujinxingia litoralis]RAL22381.1 hypothetical protein DL240_11060 [Lujinxingia litoralis]